MERRHLDGDTPVIEHRGQRRDGSAKRRPTSADAITDRKGGL